MTSLGLQQIFADEPDITYLGHVESAPECIRRFPDTDVVLLDLRLGDHSAPQYNAEALLTAGVSGVVGKAASHGDLPDAVRTVASGDTWSSPEWAAAIDADGEFRDIHLSDQQRAVLELCASGEPAKRVASIMPSGRD